MLFDGEDDLGGLSDDEVDVGGGQARGEQRNNNHKWSEMTFRDTEKDRDDLGKAAAELRSGAANRSRVEREVLEKDISMGYHMVDEYFPCASPEKLVALGTLMPQSHCSLFSNTPLLLCLPRLHGKGSEATRTCFESNSRCNWRRRKKEETSKDFHTILGGSIPSARRSGGKSSSSSHGEDSLFEERPSQDRCALCDFYLPFYKWAIGIAFWRV